MNKPEANVYKRSQTAMESARGLEALAEDNNIPPGYRSIARRAAIAMRGIAADNTQLRTALRELSKWGKQCPTTAEEADAHQQAGYAAFDRARAALRNAR
jgi:hypothetical protein